MIELYRHFPFPLNVYAHLLVRSGCPLEYLHYGLFAPGCETIAQAQAYSTRLVMERLPLPPARICEVGTGLGATMAKLLAAGYDVTGVNPDPHQILFAMQHFGVGQRIACSRWEDFDPGSQRFDLVLFQESSQYIAPAHIFSRAAALLAPEGSVLVVDEVGLRRPPGETGLNLLTELVEAAANAGLRLQEHLDLGRYAAPTVDHMLALSAQLREEMQRELGVSAEQIDVLDASNRSYREKYADGRYGYALLRFTPIPRS